MSTKITTILLFFCVCIGQINAQSSGMTLQGSLSNAQLDGGERNDVWGWYDKATGKEYALVGSQYGMNIVDVTNPTAPQYIAIIRGTDNIWRDVNTYSHYMYWVSEANDGLRIFDLNRLRTCCSTTPQVDTLTADYNSTQFFSKAHTIWIDEPMGRLYAVGGTMSGGSPAGTVRILDLSRNPLAPTNLGLVTLPGGYTHDVYVRDNIGYFSHGYTGMYIYDFTNPTSPVFLDNISTGGYSHSTWLTDDGNRIISADEVPNGLPLRYINVSDPVGNGIENINSFNHRIITTRSNPASTTPHNPYILGDYVFTAHYHDGVKVFKMNADNTVTIQAYYDTHPQDQSYSGYEGVWSVYPYLPSGNILAADIENGLYILKTTNIDLGAICPDATEPNNSFFDAHGFGGFETARGKLCTTGDEDWFVFTPGRDRTVSFKLDCLPANYELQVYNNRKVLLGSSTQLGTLAENITVTYPTGNVNLYLRVYSTEKTGWSRTSEYCLSSSRSRTFPRGILREGEVEQMVSIDKIYPNPLAQRTSLSIDTYTTEQGSAVVQVHNLLGQEILKEKIELLAGNNTHLIETGNLSAGYYQVSVIQNGHISTDLLHILP